MSHAIRSSRHEAHSVAVGIRHFLRRFEIIPRDQNQFDPGSLISREFFTDVDLHDAAPVDEAPLHLAFHDRDRMIEHEPRIIPPEVDQFLPRAHESNIQLIFHDVDHESRLSSRDFARL